MKHTYDKSTSAFRTIRNLRGYNDNEKGFPPSIVDDSDYEDINVLVARMMRGESVHCGLAVQFDGADTADNLIEASSPLNRDGVDLADAQPIVEGIKSRQAARKAVAKAEKPKVVPPASQGPAEKPAAAPSNGKA